MRARLGDESSQAALEGKPLEGGNPVRGSGMKQGHRAAGGAIRREAEKA
jgi:hypothetical protein